MEKEKIKQLIENNIAGQAGMNPYNKALVDVLNALADNSGGGSKNWYITVDSELPDFGTRNFETTAEIATHFNLSEEDFLKWWNHEIDIVVYPSSKLLTLELMEISSQGAIIQYIMLGGSGDKAEIVYNSTGSPIWQLVWHD